MYLIGLKSTNDSKRVESISETTAATSALFQTMSSKSLQPSPTDSNSSLSNSNLFNSNFSNLENLVTNNFNKEINTTKTNLLHQKIQSDIPNSNLRQKAKDIATTTTAFPATPTTNSAIADADSFAYFCPNRARIHLPRPTEHYAGIIHSPDYTGPRPQRQWLPP